MSIIRDPQEWNHYHMRMALQAAEMSKDPSTKTGCVIVRDRRIVSTGYNGFPMGVDDKEEWLNDREMKYALTIHAETNAILDAKTDLKDTYLYCTHFPCHDCAKNIVQSGIEKVFYHNRKKLEDGSWSEHYKFADIIFKNAGIFTKKVDIAV